MRNRPSGAASLRHSGTRKKRRPTSMGCNRSRDDCTQSRASSSRCRAPGKSFNSAARFTSSSKKERTVCALSSTMPAEPCSHNSAISRSRSSGSQSISRENMFEPSPPCSGAARCYFGITPENEATRYFPTNHHPIRLQREHLQFQDPAQRGEVEPHHPLRLRGDGLHRRERDAHRSEEHTSELQSPCNL